MSTIIVESVFALAVAIFLTMVFAVVGRRAKSRLWVIVFFLLVFFSAWAGGIWITPFGPSILGVFWLSYFVVGLIFALALEAVAAFHSRPVRPGSAEIRMDEKEEQEIKRVLNMFIWILLLTFIIAIVLGYIRRLG
jgi:hypothetical protein